MSLAMDIGYDGSNREERLTLLQTALRCPDMKMLREGNPDVGRCVGWPWIL